MAALIEATGLSYRYPGAADWALEGVDLSISAGEMLALTGPSACGKSTLALAIAGCLHERPGGAWCGTVHADGVDITTRSLYENAELVGLVQQSPEDQFCTLTVEDEIAFGLENRCYSRDEMSRRIAWALDVVEAPHLRNRQLATLSGGEKQRIAIASILAAKPRILILDEPTSNLDPTATQAILEVLERLRNDQGLTLIVIEHKLRALARFAPRIVRMAQGHIVDADARANANVNHATRIPATPGDVVARLENVSHWFSTRRALADLSLSIHRGQVVALMGDNGSGKSTLLRCLMGLIRPTEGRVIVLGHDQPVVSVLAKRAGIVFQNPDHQLLGDSVWDDAMMLARNTGQAELVRPRAERQLRQGGLWHRRADSPWTLSYGQKRRLNLVTATSHDPDLVLADEILIGQDPTNARGLMQHLRMLADQGSAVVVSLHNLAVAEQYADRVLFLEGGRLALDGSLDALRAFLLSTGHEAYLESAQ
ncbi:MAG: ABC transporter ATP-binding protein [Anaerolineae bacterium]